MLEKCDFALNQRMFSIYSSLGFIQLGFSDEFTRATYRACRWRAWLWKTCWFMAFIFEVFKAFRLIQALVYPELRILEHVMLHVVHCSLLFVALYTSVNLSRRWPEIVAIFNYSFGDIPTASKGIGRRDTLPLECLVRKLRTLTKSELIIVTVLPAFVGSTVTEIGFFAHDPARIDFIYSAIPAKYQTKLLLYACLLTEFFILNFAICHVSFAGIMQLGTFRKCLLDAELRLVAVSVKLVLRLHFDFWERLWSILQ